MPVKYSFLVFYILASITMHTSWASTLGVLETYRVGVFKKWGTKYEIQILHSSGKIWELRIPSQLFDTVPWVEFIGNACFSLLYPFICGHFLICPKYRSHSVHFWIYFRGNYYVCSCAFNVFIRREEFRSPLCCHVGPYVTGQLIRILSMS